MTVRPSVRLSHLVTVRRVALEVLPPELAYGPAVLAGYLVIAEILGGNLAALLANEPRLPMDEVRRATGRAMVTDFGIASAIESG